MNPSLMLAVGMMIGLALAVAGLFRPFLGAVVFIVIHFVQPGELIPALAPLRIELVYGVLLIATIFAHRLSSPRHSLLQDKILYAVFLLLVSAALSVPFSVWRGGAITTILEMVKLIAVMILLTVMVDSKAHLRQMLWCMTAIGAWLACSSLSAFAHGQFYTLGKLERAEGMNSIVGGPNELAGLLMALLPLQVALFRTTRNIFPRVLLVVCGIASLAAISLTGSRIAVVGLLAIAVYYSFQSKQKVLTLVVCIVIASVTWKLLPTEYKTRYVTVESYANGGQLDASNQFRLEIWKAGEKIFLQSPIFGVGAGQFATAYGLTYLEQGLHRAWMNPHNLLIQVACELGIVGVVVFGYFVWQIAQAIRYVIRKKKMRGIELNYQTAVALSVMYVAVVIISLVSHTLYRPYWYILAGLVAANRNIVAATVKAPRKKVVDNEPPTEPSPELQSLEHSPAVPVDS
jgi:putative inorganic carbon (hco3(-)) transporter